MSRVHAPIGLALGGRTPPEIAVSIAAELVALRHGGDGSSMNVIAEVLGK
jgi:xanthine dehydrogenase accessory factor